MLSDTDAIKSNAGVEEGEIAERSGAAVNRGIGGNLADESAGPEDLVKPNTFFMVRSLMKQSDLDTLVSEDCFTLDSYQLPGKETTPKPKKNESVMFRDFFTAGFCLPVPKRFADILAAYKVQIHQLTPNSFPQVLKFLWAF
jgi:hypothetical protein